MIPVRHAPHRSTSNNIRGFRDIKHSTYSKRLFTGFGGDKKLNVRAIKPELDGFNFGGLKLSGGYLEAKWLGRKLDNIAGDLFDRLQGGGVLMGFAGNLLASAYRSMRFNIINRLIALLYQLVVKLLTAVYNIIWRILFIPLIIVASVLILLLLVDVTFIFDFIGQVISSILSFFIDIFSSPAE